MFCSKCGSQLHSGAAFCKTCGAGVGNTQQSPASTAPQSAVTCPNNTETLSPATPNTASDPSTSVPFISAAKNIQQGSGGGKVIGIVLIVISVLIDFIGMAVFGFEFIGAILAVSGVLFLIGLLLSMFSQ